MSSTISVSHNLSPAHSVGMQHGALTVESVDLDYATDIDFPELVSDGQIWVYTCRCACGSIRTYRGEIKPLRCNRCRSVETAVTCPICGRRYNTRNPSKPCPYSHVDVTTEAIIYLFDIFDPLTMDDISSSEKIDKLRRKHQELKASIRSLLTKAA